MLEEDLTLQMLMQIYAAVVASLLTVSSHSGFSLNGVLLDEDAEC